MLIHSVFFWLKPELTEAQRAAFVREGLESLRPIKSVQALHIGKPAPLPPRAVVDQTYSFALSIQFADVAGHDAYQIDPVHQAFVEKFRTYWTRVQIYDAC